ncbi:RNA polymerase sigma-70 factor [Massilibacteroides sp.]|uniref:RNA polymerase sigma factor n=1 Tax=Massilibacteroides sp. TaxID=2034766 RepID=UPI00263107E7|nr:RNA polymerase sigma-70 factor [Massilibacteroides sp.]MDD4516305.1 RNA polymerase sigma-70 factor [Massilibacteroides sp.]
MQINDSQIKRIVKGDQNAFRLFMDMYSKDLFFFAQGYVNSRETAEEIVSDVFLEVWHNRQALDQIRSIKSWLLTIVRNRAISYLRKTSVNHSVISFDSIEDFFLPAVVSPDEQIISKEEIENINRAINNLSPKCKEVFLLAKFEKLPYKEIAKMLNISVKTIDVHIANAIQKISEILYK